MWSGFDVFWHWAIDVFLLASFFKNQICGPKKRSEPTKNYSNTNNEEHSQIWKWQQQCHVSFDAIALAVTLNNQPDSTLSSGSSAMAERMEPQARTHRNAVIIFL